MGTFSGGSKGGVPLSRTFLTALVRVYEAGAQNGKKGGSTEPKEPPGSSTDVYTTEEFHQCYC